MVCNYTKHTCMQRYDILLLYFVHFMFYIVIWYICTQHNKHIKGYMYNTIQQYIYIYSMKILFNKIVYNKMF